MKHGKIIFTLGLLVLTLFALSNSSDAKKRGKSSRPLEEADIYFEVNETDGDAEVVVEVETEDDAIKRLVVRDPTGRKIIDVKSKDRVRLGLAEVAIESAEPNINDVKAAYPEGTYTFTVITMTGDQLVGTADLSHVTLPAPTFTPSDGEEVGLSGVVIEWDPVEGAEEYIVEVEIEEEEEGDDEEDEEEDDEEEEFEFELTLEVEGGVNRLEIPDSLLRPGLEYKIGVGAVSEDDNITVAESTFVTIGE